jgi:hypothetical protein
MSLEKEIADSIKKNLPQQVGDVLKEKLEQEAKQLNALVEAYRESIFKSLNK